ncbi:MAG: response regulator transcription factor [Lachnospiraceae bacterium]|nr:response regulator transcription factor [Lachnospiraceae bacterium]MCR5087736.1 response regulator transcription factor [Lachnospiraceae bacterium]
MDTILIVDDDVAISKLLSDALTEEGFAVRKAYSGTEALMAVAAERPDLILLDRMLPGLSGEEVLPSLQGIPVIIVSARADTMEKVDLLLGGAADYITKPFRVEELIARVRVALRDRRQPQEETRLSVGGIVLDRNLHTVSFGEKSAKLTRTESAIAGILMNNRDRVMAKLTLLELIAQDTPDCTEDSLKVHVHNLRRKLREITGRDCIVAVWGIGFRFVSAENAE